MRRITIFVLLLLFIVVSGAYSQKVEKATIDSLIINIKQLQIALDSLTSNAALQAKQLDSLCYSVHMTQNETGMIEFTTMIIEWAALLFGVFVIIFGYMTYQNDKILKDSKVVAGKAEAAADLSKKAEMSAVKAKDEAEKSIAETAIKLERLNENLKRIVSESGLYAEYFLVFFNNAMPPEKKLDQDIAKFAMELASLDESIRSAAIKNLLANLPIKGKASLRPAIPYLEWVMKYRKSSKKDAEEAIRKIL